MKMGESGERIRESGETIINSVKMKI